MLRGVTCSLCNGSERCNSLPLFSPPIILLPNWTMNDDPVSLHKERTRKLISLGTEFLFKRTKADSVAVWGRRPKGQKSTFLIKKAFFFSVNNRNFSCGSNISELFEDVSFFPVPHRIHENLRPRPKKIHCFPESPNKVMYGVNVSVSLLLIFPAVTR